MCIFKIVLDDNMLIKEMYYQLDDVVKNAENLRDMKANNDKKLLINLQDMV